MHTAMEIRQLTHPTPEQYKQMHALMCVLSTHCRLTPQMLEQATRQAQVYVLEHQGTIIGTATLSPYGSPTGRKASIEDVVVLPQYQGQHLGRRLVQHLVDVARTMAPITLHLTSRPSRIAANALYRQLGFQQRETNVYKMEL